MLTYQPVARATAGGKAWQMPQRRKRREEICRRVMGRGERMRWRKEWRGSRRARVWVPRARVETAGWMAGGGMRGRRRRRRPRREVQRRRERAL